MFLTQKGLWENILSLAGPENKERRRRKEVCKQNKESVACFSSRTRRGSPTGSGLTAEHTVAWILSVR